MTNPKFEVIDLTESFTLADHSTLANIVIELDDSLNEVNRSRLSVQADEYGDQPHRPTSVLSRTIPFQSSTSTHRRSTKKSKLTKTRDQKDETQQVPTIRERSPVTVGDCAICFERIGKNPLVSTKCGHVFCKLCLEQALRLDKKCPTCRRILKGSTAYHPLFLSQT